MKPAVVFFAFAVLIAGATFGEINIVDSLEWMTVDSQLIVKGTVTGITGVEQHDSYRDVTIAVAETLKGESPGKRLTIRVRQKSNPQVWQDSSHTYLFFVVKGDRDRHGRAVADHWTHREYRQSAIDLDEPKGVCKADMTKPKDSEEILKIVGEYAGQDRPGPGVGSPNIFKPQDGYLRLEIPFDAAIFGEVFWGSTCYINVPAEEKYRPLAVRLAKTEIGWDRAHGAGMLRNYPGNETVRLLTTLLQDPNESQWSQGADHLVRIAYPVRLAAYDSLVALGEKPDKPVVEREPTDEEKRAFRESYWKQAMKDVLPEGWEVVSVSVVESPGGSWKRTAGGDGVAVVCRKPDKDLDADPKPRIGRAARLTLYAMPRDWEGEDTRNGGTIDDDKFIRTRGSLEAEQSDAAPYLGRNAQGHFFCTAFGLDPRATFTRYFGLTTDEAEPDKVSE